MLRCLIVLLIAGGLVQPTSAATQLTESELFTLFESVAATRQAIDKIEIEGDIQSMSLPEGWRSNYRFVTRLDGQNFFYGTWFGSKLDFIVTRFGANTSSNRGPWENGEQNNATHYLGDATAADGMAFFAVEPKQLGLHNFIEFMNWPLSSFLPITEVVRKKKRLTSEEVTQDGMRLLEITMESRNDHKTIGIWRIDPKTLRVHRCKQVPGYFHAGHLQIDSTFSESNTSVIPDHIVAVEVDENDQVQQRNEWMVTKLDLNPNFDDASFGLKSLGLEIGQDVAVPSLHVGRYWNGNELQTERISPRIMAAVEEVTQPENRWSMTTITLLVLAGMGAALLGIRQIVARRSPS